MTLIPTAFKEKPPKGFTYPVGAEGISNALLGVPQFGLLTLSFSWKDTFWASEHKVRVGSAGAITVLEVWYSRRAQLDSHWKITVHAVPSTESKCTKELLEKSLQTLKRQLLNTELKPEYFSWKAIYDQASRVIQAG